MEEKAKIVIEIEKDCFRTACYLVKEKLTDEVWQKLSSEPILLSTNDIGEEVNQVKLVIACVTMAKKWKNDSQL